MAKELTEGMKNVARALIGDPPGTREKEELYRQVGRAIVRLSDTENLLAMLFAICSLGSADDAAEFFSSAIWFREKTGSRALRHEGNCTKGRSGSMEQDLLGA